jgi:hypothetical protein
MHGSSSRCRTGNAVRAATAADIAAWYGELAVPATLLAIDGGIGGLARIEGELWAVSWLADDVGLIMAARLGAAVMRLVSAADEPVYAEADIEEPTAGRTLRHYGFEPKGERYVYRAPARG